VHSTHLRHNSGQLDTLDHAEVTGRREAAQASVRALDDARGALADVELVDGRHAEAMLYGQPPAMPSDHTPSKLHASGRPATGRMHRSRRTSVGSGRTAPVCPLAPCRVARARRATAGRAGICARCGLSAGVLRVRRPHPLARASPLPSVSSSSSCSFSSSATWWAAAVAAGCCCAPVLVVPVCTRPCHAEHGCCPPFSDAPC
jgi:hypothetical protein